MWAKTLIICMFIALCAESMGVLQVGKNAKNSVFRFLGSNRQSQVYLISNSPVGYALAESDCNWIGGKLAQFETVGEKEYAEYYFSDFFSHTTDFGLGGRCGSNQGRYEWDDSTQILPSVWGESNSNPIEPCQANYRVGARRVGRKLELYGFPLNVPKYYICEVSWF